MSISATKKAYRQTASEKEKRRAYAQAYRQRPVVKATEAERARTRRASETGAAENRRRVKEDRANLGRAYITDLLSHGTELSRTCFTAEIVDLKRMQLVLKRLHSDLVKQIKNCTNL